MENDDDEPLTLQVNSAASPVAPPPGTDNTADTIDEKIPGKERGSVKKKRKKKKKKFVVRAKAESPTEGGQPPIPFYLAQTTSSLMTPKQQRQMEDLLLGGNANGSEPKDVVNPLHGAGQSKRSVEKKRQRAEGKRRKEMAAAAGGGDGDNVKSDAKVRGVEGKTDGDGDDGDSGVVERTPVQMLGEPVSLLPPSEQKEEEGPSMTLEEIKEESKGAGEDYGVANMTLSPMHLTPPPGLPPLAQMQKKANVLPPLGRRSSSVGSAASLGSRASPLAWGGGSSGTGGGSGTGE